MSILISEDSYTTYEIPIEKPEKIAQAPIFMSILISEDTCLHKHNYAILPEHPSYMSWDFDQQYKMPIMTNMRDEN